MLRLLLTFGSAAGGLQSLHADLSDFVAEPPLDSGLAAELRAAVGDHVAAYRLLAEVAGDARAADAHVARFGDDARRARDRVLEMASRSASRAPDPKPRFSLRGKVS